MSQGTAQDVRTARRVLCYGTTGSGKSTLAAALAERLDLPLTLVDELGWDPGWGQVAPEELDRRIVPRLEADRYVFDSVYGRQCALALERVDVVVALDYPRLVSLARLLRRTARRVRTGELTCNGNRETLGRALSPRHSIIRWHFRSWRRKRERMRAWHAAADAPPVLLLRRPADAVGLLEELA
ncbi:adenylate kinase [Ruania suaedae]|uniref:adenylate kinase n=1 Tax=Ruania suaedae TaxID=2897774 RepID=UPI001E459D18|nr:adenylate kinase [Ruania suaedae]UFU02442.1 adenylate kinase [Ruania suaedae]